MYNDDNQGLKGAGARKQALQKFAEIKKGNYSPSASYNYNPTSSFSAPQNMNANGNQIPRRRENGPPHVRRDSNNSSTERLARQNDIIIRLLKEIRDRLPAPPPPARSEKPSRKKGEQVNFANEQELSDQGCEENGLDSDCGAETDSDVNDQAQGEGSDEELD